MKRFIKINGTGKLLELSKVVAVDVEKEMFHFDKLTNGTWRLTYTKSLIDNIQNVQSFEIIRED